MTSRNRIFMHEELDLKANSNSNENSRIKNNSESENFIGQSGNSDVDLKVDVNIDTTAIGFAMLCSLFATGQMTNEQFHIAVRKLEELTKKKVSDFSAHDVNNLSNVRLFNEGSISIK
jgi:hypothetical protein